MPAIADLGNCAGVAVNTEALPPHINQRKSYAFGVMAPERGPHCGKWTPLSDVWVSMCYKNSSDAQYDLVGGRIRGQRRLMDQAEGLMLRAQTLAETTVLGPLISGHLARRHRNIAGA